MIFDDDDSRQVPPPENPLPNATLTGGFVYDTVLGEVVSGDFLVSGLTGSLSFLNGSYTGQRSFSARTPQFFQIAQGLAIGAPFLEFIFEFDLFFDGPFSVGDTMRLSGDNAPFRDYSSFVECQGPGTSCISQSTVAVLDGTATVVPLPPTLSLMVTGLALAGLVAVGRRRRSG